MLKTIARCINSNRSKIVPVTTTLFIALFASTGSASLPQQLKEVEARYAAAKTIQAEFVQTNMNNGAIKNQKISSGTLHVKRPGKMRWQTFQPDPNILVSDGKTFWFYTPPFEEGEAGQVVIKKSNEVQSRLAQALLTGDFSANKTMKVKKISETIYDLFPKKGTASTVTKARVEITIKNKLIEKVTLFHSDGNQSEVALKKIELGKNLGDDLFVFIAPPGTEKITSP